MQLLRTIRRMIFFLLLSQVNLFSQTILLQEDFTNYQADIGSMPAGWMFSSHNNYTSSTYAGTSGPNSYKFAANNASISSPVFALGDSIKFWIKGVSVDTLSKLIVLESADSIGWDTLAVVCPLPTKAAEGNKSFSLKNTVTHLRFTYVKSKGNLAFDDFKVYGTAIPTGQKELLTEMSNGFVFPNPAIGGCFSVHATVTSKITVCNSLGEVVRVIEAAKETEIISLLNVPPGIYFVNVKGKDSVNTQKIIIQ